MWTGSDLATDFDREDAYVNRMLDAVAAISRVLEDGQKTEGENLPLFNPFSGVGNALIACELNGLPCYAIEQDPWLVDATIIRWQQLTGKLAIRRGTTDREATQ